MKICQDFFEHADGVERLDEGVILYHLSKGRNGIYFLAEDKTITYMVDYRSVDQSEKIPQRVPALGKSWLFVSGQHLFTPQVLLPRFSGIISSRSTVA